MSMMSIRWNRWAALLLAAALVAGCSSRSPNDSDGDGDGGGTKKDAPFWTAEGWTRYENYDFIGARNAFNNALSKDSLYAPGVSGLAYTNLELGYTGLSYNQFKEAVGLDSSLVEAYYGAAYMAHAQAIAVSNLFRDYLLRVVEFGVPGLDLGGDAFQFPHNPTVNSLTLRILLARSYYGLADYEEAERILDILDPENNVTNSSSTYILDLLLAIESLEGTAP